MGTALGEIPVGHEVGRKIIEEVVGGALRGGEKARVLSVAIGHGKAIDGPGLAARPGGVGARALGGEFAEDRAVGVVINDVKRAAIGADVILHGFYGVAYSHVVPAGVAAILRGEKEELEIHHVVDDDGDVAIVVGPGFDDAGGGTIEGGHGLRGGLDHAQVGRIASDAIGVAVAAENFETDVVVGSVGVLAEHAASLGGSAGHPGIVESVLEHVPEGAREKTAGPLAGSCEIPMIGVGGIGLGGKLRGAGVGEGAGELALREGQDLVSTAYGLGVNRKDGRAPDEHDQE